MKKTVFLYALVGLAGLMVSCKKEIIKPSGDITTESRSVGGFTSLEVSDALEVQITHSATAEGVTVEANSNLHPYIKTDVVAGTLRIRMKDKVHIKPGAMIVVHVTDSDLDRVTASQASDVRLQNNWQGTSMDVHLSGASKFKGEMNVDLCNMRIKGASDGNIWGSADEMYAELSGASRLIEYGFGIGTLTVKLSGASESKLTVNDLLNVTASGASSFDYMGNAQIGTLEVSGGSNVTKH